MSIRALWLLPIAMLLVECAFRLMPQGFMRRTIDERMKEIVTLPVPRLQIMGDSVTAGINAANLAQTAGMPVDEVGNYSLPGTSPVFAYYALKRELATGRTPGRILYAPHPSNLETPMIDRFVGRFGTPQECVGLLFHGVSPPDWLFGLACRMSVAMRDREEFRAALTEGNFGFLRRSGAGGIGDGIAGADSGVDRGATGPAYQGFRFSAATERAVFCGPGEREVYRPVL